MASTDKSTPTYITPLRRSLGLSRRLTGNTNSPITPPAATTPLRASYNYISPSISRTFNDENINTTPISINATPQQTKCLMSPLKQESTNRRDSTKRIFRLSLGKSKIHEHPLVKKKKLEFCQNEVGTEYECENKSPAEALSFDEVQSTTNNDDDDYISPSQMVSFELLTQIPNSELESNDELANELKEIELLKQKQYRRRISYGLKVREEKLLDIDKLNSSVQIRDLCKEIGLSQVIGFQTARQEIEAIPNSNTTQQKIHLDEITEIRNLIKIWRRGLRDAVEYLSCLTYPPADIPTILKHHDIPIELWMDK